MDGATPSGRSGAAVRVLIVGGGMSGWTLASHLIRRGIIPTLVERAEAYARAGFWIGLYPFSANTLRETGVYERYAQASLPMQDYVMNDARGSTMQAMSFAEVLGTIHGFMGAMERADLLALLVEGGSGTDLRMGTTVSSLDQRDDLVSVTFSDGRYEDFDAVFGCDGIHSGVRRLLTGDPQAGLKDWGFTAFTWWAPRQQALGDSVVEYWGAGGLFGLYPAPDRLNAIGGMPTPDGLAGMSQAETVAAVREHFSEYPGPVQEVLSHAESDTVYAWPMIDQKADAWIYGRVALVGDAATGFLPTAGVGASNAMKSADVLADELGRADRETIPLALSMWEKRVRAKIEANQTASRRLAQMMFVKGQGLAKVRDIALEHYPVEKIAEDVLKSNTEPW